MPAQLHEPGMEPVFQSGRLGYRITLSTLNVVP